MSEVWTPASKPCNFEGIGMCFYEAGEFREPKRGEFYLSGAIVEAWRAPNPYPLGSRYRIVRPTHRAVQKTYWAEGERVVLVVPKPGCTIELTPPGAS